MVSSAPGSAFRMMRRTRRSTGCTSSGCFAIYSSTPPTAGLATRDPPVLDVRRLRHRTLVDHVARVQRRSRLEQHKLDFFTTTWLVLDAARHDDQFAGADDLEMVPKIHAKLAADDEEQFVFDVVMMPDEVAFELDDLDLLAVEVGDDFRRPVLVDE